MCRETRHGCQTVDEFEESKLLRSFGVGFCRPYSSSGTEQTCCLLVQLILEAPSDVLSFHFHPQQGNVLVAGCVNGQVAFWDITSATEKRKNKEQNKPLPSDDTKKRGPVTLIPFLISSSIEHSHKKPITDLVWLPNFQIFPDGTLIPTNYCSQFITVASDGQILVWDIKDFLRSSTPHTSDFISKSNNNLSEFDLQWCPVFKTTLGNPETGVPHAITRACILTAEASNFKLLCSTEVSAGAHYSDIRGRKAFCSSVNGTNS